MRSTSAPIRPRVLAPRRDVRWLASLAIVALVVALTTALGGAAAPAGAAPATTTLDLAPVADSYVSPRAPHRNHGHATSVKAGSPKTSAQVGYLRFQLPATADPARVAAAQLRLTRTTHHLSGTVVARAVATNHWSETGVDAANAPTVGRALDSAATSRATNTVTLDVTDAVRGRATVTVAITLSAPRGFVQFKSRESPTESPVLQLTLARPATAETPTTPEPESDSPAASPGRGSGPGDIIGTGSGQDCTVSAKLVPSCGVWWGSASLRSQDVPLAQAVRVEEQLDGRRLDIVHEYHRNGQLFPTAEERALALEPGANRLLLLNWKPATDLTWAAVAAGRADARIDRLARYIDATFPYKFFLTIWHEPENDVVATPGSGMTAADYAAMYRHVVLRLRADGVTNAVTVMNYMGFDKWATTPWFGQLWPGDDVVDWIGIDPYGTGAPSGWTARELATLVNRPDGYFPGFYTWARKAHPGKPMMLAEWGVEYVASNPAGQAHLLADMARQLASFPNIKALVYFDMPQLSRPSYVTSPAVNATALAAYRQLANSPAVAAPAVSYPSPGSSR